MKGAIAALSAVLLAATASASASGVGAGFRVTVSGSGHVAKAGALWHYTVRATNGAGRPVGGTAIVRVLARGHVVDTVGWFGFKGVLKGTYRWPAALIGADAVLQAKVVGSGGTRATGYGVHVRSAFAATTGHPRFRLRLLPAGHTAVAQKPWRYTVRVFNAKGPVGATAIVRVLAHGNYVDTVGWFRLNGRLRRTYRWSPRLVGSSALFQVRVYGPGGTRAVRYRVRVG
jgi:hypothetical protein